MRAWRRPTMIGARLPTSLGRGNNPYPSPIDSGQIAQETGAKDHISGKRPVKARRTCASQPLVPLQAPPGRGTQPDNPGEGSGKMALVGEAAGQSNLGQVAVGRFQH